MVAGMVAGADSFADLDLLRHGAMGRVFRGSDAAPGWQNGDEHRAGDCPGGQRCGSQRGRGRGNEHGRSRGADDAGAVVGQGVQAERAEQPFPGDQSGQLAGQPAGQRGPAAPAGDQNSQDHRQREPFESGGGDGERAAESQRRARNNQAGSGRPVGEQTDDRRGKDVGNQRLRSADTRQRLPSTKPKGDSPRPISQEQPVGRSRTMTRHGNWSSSSPRRRRCGAPGPGRRTRS